MPSRQVKCASGGQCVVAGSSLLARARELSTLIPRQRRDQGAARSSVHQRVNLARELWRARLPRDGARPTGLRPPRWRRLPEPEDAGQRWRSRPFIAGGLKLLVVLIPAAAAILATTLLNWGMAPPRSWLLRIGWLLILLAVSTVVAMAVQTQTRRLLPLAVLFKLTLLFPDEAPSRYQLARAAGNPQKLQELAQGQSRQARAATHVLAWVAQLSKHDRHTRGHSERVRVFADLIAEQLKVTGLDRDKLRWAALLHDIGKLRVPATLLNKPAKPSRSEWDVLRQHPAAGMALVGPLAAWLGPWAGGIADHHERYDGTGYPNGLRGEQISLAGRIVCVADAYETMTATRAYKRPMAAAAGRAELARCAGSHFDPVVVRAFLAVGLPRLLHGIGPVSFLLNLPFLTRLPEAGIGLLTAAGQVAAPVAAGLTAASVVSAGVVAPLASSLPGSHASTTTSASGSASASTQASGSALTRGVDLTASAVTPSRSRSGSSGAASDPWVAQGTPAASSPTSTSPKRAATTTPPATSTAPPTTPSTTSSTQPTTSGTKGTNPQGGGSTTGSGGTTSGGSTTGTTSPTKSPNVPKSGGSSSSGSSAGSTTSTGSTGASSGGAGSGVTHGKSGKTKDRTAGG